MKEEFEAFETVEAKPVVDLAGEFRCAQQQNLESQANQPREVAPSVEAPTPRIDQAELGNPTVEAGPFEPTLRAELRNRFHDSPVPHQWLKYEKPHHRMIAMLSAEGNTIKEIAEITGFNRETVTNVLRQPWMQRIILDHIAAHSDRVMLEIRAECMASKRVIAELRDTAESEPVRLKAAQDFLDRTYGKPNQPMSVSQVDASQLSDDELAKLALKQN